MVDLKHWIPILFVCLICLFCATEALYPNGTCDSDADCHSLVIENLFCCIGTEWCCPYGYDCTGTSTCKGIRWQETDKSFGDDSNERERIRNSNQSVIVNTIIVTSILFGLIIFGILVLCGCCKKKFAKSSAFNSVSTCVQ